MTKWGAASSRVTLQRMNGESRRCGVSMLRQSGSASSAAKTAAWQLAWSAGVSQQRARCNQRMPQRVQVGTADDSPAWVLLSMVRQT